MGSPGGRGQRREVSTRRNTSRAIPAVAASRLSPPIWHTDATIAVFSTFASRQYRTVCDLVITSPFTIANSHQHGETDRAHPCSRTE
jgi:hypothetical protein